MSPDDPRHGTVRGHMAHQRGGGDYCAPCLAAKSMYDKRRRWDTLNGRGYTVPAMGARRRIQALQAIGWSRQRIAQEAGWGTSGALRYVDRSDTITRNSYERIVEVYERLCMIVPVGAGPDHARRFASRHGYVPPLAWDDIDDPDEQPADWHYRSASRADILRELVDQGATISDACRHLHRSRVALEKYCQRNGLTDVYRVLTEREQGGDRWRVREGAA